MSQFATSLHGAGFDSPQYYYLPSSIVSPLFSWFSQSIVSRLKKAPSYAQLHRDYHLTVPTDLLMKPIFVSKISHHCEKKSLHRFLLIVNDLSPKNITFVSQEYHTALSVNFAAPFCDRPTPPEGASRIELSALFTGIAHFQRKKCNCTPYY